MEISIKKFGIAVFTFCLSFPTWADQILFEGLVTADALNAPPDVFGSGVEIGDAAKFFLDFDPSEIGAGQEYIPDLIPGTGSLVAYPGTGSVKIDLGNLSFECPVRGFFIYDDLSIPEIIPGPIDLWGVVASGGLHCPIHPTDESDLIFQLYISTTDTTKISSSDFFVPSSVDGFVGVFEVIWFTLVDLNMVALNIVEGTITTLNSPHGLLSLLVQRVDELNAQTRGNALYAKLRSITEALDRLNAGDEPAAMGLIYAFIQSVKALSGKSLTNSEAESLIESANLILTVLEQ